MRKFISRGMLNIGSRLIQRHGEWYDDDFYEELSVIDKVAVHLVYTGMKLNGQIPPKYILRLVGK